MGNRINHLRDWTSVVGELLAAANAQGIGPVEACKQFDKARSRLRNQLEVFKSLQNSGDKIVEPIIHTAQRLIDAVPQNGKSFEDHTSIKKTLYVLGTLAQETEFFLTKLAGISDTTDQYTPMDVRPKETRDIGWLKQPGYIPEMVQKCIAQACSMDPSEINMRNLVMQLQKFDVQVATNSSMTGEQRHGMFASEVLHYGNAKTDGQENIFLEGVMCTVNKKQLAIRERVIKIVAWSKEFPRSVPYSFVRHLWQDTTHDTVRFPEVLHAHIPLK